MAGKWRVVQTDDTCWGRPRLDGTRLTVEFIVGRFASGESIAELAEDYRCEQAAIEELVRSVAKAAYGNRGLLAEIERRLLANIER
jgi:uncharacterized protein (DUF433 family)